MNIIVINTIAMNIIGINLQIIWVVTTELVLNNSSKVSISY